MPVIKVNNSSSDWFKGPGWYIVDKNYDVLGPFHTEIAARTKEVELNADNLPGSK